MAGPGATLNIGVVNNWDRASNAYSGRLEAFRLGPQGDVQHNWQTAVNNGWSGWNSFGVWPQGSEMTQFTVGQNADGRLEVFAVDVRQASWHIWQVADNSGWSGWEQL